MSAAKKVAVHIIDEKKSPPSEMTSSMWCGATCVELFYGPRTPDLKFYPESHAQLATCPACREAFAARVVSL